MINGFPPSVSIETVKILRKLSEAHRYLAELKGLAASIPDQRILLDTLALQEAKESSAIEDIITTQDEIYQSDFEISSFASQEAKEVHKYAEALKLGFAAIKEKSFITINLILQMQEVIEANSAGFRKMPGTVLKNDITGEVVYTPPQHIDEIKGLMSDLEKFINDDELYEADPLTKMALIHHQFESVHPFYDGNGRTGRIINILYLIRSGLLDLPILYLSGFVIKNKTMYYKLLQDTRNSNNWEPWVLFMLEGIAETSKETIVLVKEISKLLLEFKHAIRNTHPKIYSQDLLNNLFRHPYTRIEFVMNDLQVSRLTATRYLTLLTEANLLKKIKIGRNSYFLNERLFSLLKNKK